MLLIEADGKALLRSCGIATPQGIVVAEPAPALAGYGPWIVKAQVPVGGRGKAGGVIRCESEAAEQPRQRGCSARRSRAT